MREQQRSIFLQIAGVGVHLYTATGAVLALLTIMEAINGNTILALWYSLASVFIDSTDGMLARKFNVSKNIPWFDGRRLDDIVDYLTYVFAPMVLLWQNGFLPEGITGQIIAIVPLLASAYQFCRVDAKTDDYKIIDEDHFFLGFPSYWNVVAFYAVVMQLSPTMVSTIIIVCSILVFVPIRYIYPSRTVLWRRVTLIYTSLCSLGYAVILWQMPWVNSLMIYFTLSYVVYYFVMSGVLTIRLWQPKTVANANP